MPNCFGPLYSGGRDHFAPSQWEPLLWSKHNNLNHNNPGERYEMFQMFQLGQYAECSYGGCRGAIQIWMDQIT